MIFDERYEVFLADTPESKALHYRLRYKVYCEETGWERNQLFIQEKLERDGFDATSHHFLVRDRLTLEWLGGLRLVEQPFYALPISKFCQINGQNQYFFGQDGCVEVSRLFVLPDFRCGRQQGFDKLEASRLGRASHYYEVMLGLIRAAREFGLNKGINSWYFLVEPALARIIKRVGIDLYRCGPGVQHRGLRHPYCGEVGTCFNGVFLGSDDVRLMFSRAGTFRSCSSLGEDGLREKVLEPSIRGAGRELAIA